MSEKMVNQLLTFFVCLVCEVECFFFDKEVEWFHPHQLISHKLLIIIDMRGRI
jgi:hypothetical protein